MVGQRFCEKLVEFDTDRRFRIVTFCEEPRAAYDRVGLTSFFAHRDAEKLMLARQEWYRENGVELHLGDRASAIDRQKRDRPLRQRSRRSTTTTSCWRPARIRSCRRCRASTSRACSSIARSRTWSRSSATPQQSKRCAVIGGGLLGLEAAKAAYDLGLETHVVEFAPRLMPRQVDDAGSRMLVSKIEVARRAASTSTSPRRRSTATAASSGSSSPTARRSTSR